MWKLNSCPQRSGEWFPEPEKRWREDGDGDRCGQTGGITFPTV